MEFLPADYVILAFTAFMMVTGLFRGLSGTIAFLVATLVSVAAAGLGWRVSADYLSATWQRGSAVAIGTLLVFGVSRMIIRKSVNVLLAQPGDAIFGFLSGIILGGVLVLVWGYSGIFLEYSNLAAAAHSFIAA